MPTSNPLIGRRITNIRQLTKAEIADEGWSERNTYHFAIVLDDGTLIYASRDQKGDGPGVLFGRTSEGTHITIGTAG